MRKKPSSITLFNLESDTNGKLKHGVIAREYKLGTRQLSNLALYTVQNTTKKTYLGIFAIENKSIFLNTRTPYCSFKNGVFYISAGLMESLYELGKTFNKISPLRVISIKHNGKTYSTTLRYLAFKGTWLQNWQFDTDLPFPLRDRDLLMFQFISISKDSCGLRTAQIWENFIDTNHLGELSVFDLFALSIPFSKWEQAISNNAAYQKRFLDSGDN